MTSNTGLKIMVLVKGEYLKMEYFYVQLQITILVDLQRTMSCWQAGPRR